MLNGRTGARRARGSRYSDDPIQNPQSLGCGACGDRDVCGRLHVRASAWDCLTFCCGGEEDCDNVCPRDVPSFVARVREVAGFSLDALPRVEVQERPILPGYVPLIYHASKRDRPFAPPAVALPLYGLIDRKTDCLRYPTRAELCEAYQVSESCAIVLSGTEKDPPLERWWGLEERRLTTIQGLTHLGLAVVTTPNYSFFSDVPRWDNLHAMKRIAITWQEMASVGLRAALHVNARTAQDWRRWRDFVGERPEVNTLSFEFGTGAGRPPRLHWHADQLCGLADEVRRPLTLIVRGGKTVLKQLRDSYTDVSFLDATPFFKAVHRQMACNGKNGRISWRPMAGTGQESVPELLDHNFLELSDAWRSTADGGHEKRDEKALAGGRLP